MCAKLWRDVHVQSCGAMSKVFLVVTLVPSEFDVCDISSAVVRSIASAVVRSSLYQNPSVFLAGSRYECIKKILSNNDFYQFSINESQAT